MVILVRTLVAWLLTLGWALCMSLPGQWLLPTSCLAAAAAQASAAIRVDLVFDNSWSMTDRVGTVTRSGRAVAAGERWVATLQVPSSLTVDLLTASDHVEVVGTFALRSEADRAALIEAIRRIHPVRGTRTNFAAIDKELADVIRRDTGVGEDFALILLTDAISDTPGSDLRADEIGEHTIHIGGGVYAVVLGRVPGVRALASRGTPKQPTNTRNRSRAGHASAVRTLRSGVIHLEGQPAVAGAVGARLFGGWEPLRTDIRVHNPVGVARLVRFESIVPADVVADFSPNPLLVPAGGSATVTVALSAPQVTQGEVVAIAHLPDGRSQQHTIYIHLAPRHWAVQHAWFLALSIVSAVLVSTVIGQRARRTVRVGHHADAGKQAALAVGDTMPLAMFARDVTGALRRGWLGYTIIAESHPVSISGRLVQPGGRGRYRLGEDIQVGNTTFAIYGIDAATPGGSAAEWSAAPSNRGWATGGLR